MSGRSRSLRGPKVLAAAVLGGVCLTPIVLTPAPAAAAGSALTSESFSGTSVEDPAFVPLGAACLTAASSAPSAAVSALGKCTRNRNSPVGTPGFLQLTDASNDQAGGVVYNRALPANGGVRITFDQYQYGGTNWRGGADGIAFFLVDGSVNLTALGSPGGGLGYTPAHSTYPGVRGGFVGVGLDVYGNFATDTIGYQGAGCAKKSPHPHARPNSVVVRGAGDGTTGYCWLADNTDLPAKLRGSSATDTDLARRTVRITVTPNSPPTLTVEIDFYNERGIQSVLTTQLPAALPPTFKLGFAGSTGGVNDVHLIRNVSVASVEELPPLNLVKQVNRTRPQPASYTVGDTVPYEFVVTNTTGAEVSDIVISDPGVSSVSCPSTTLAPAGRAGSTMVCAGSHVITADDARQPSFTNTASVRGTARAEPVTSTSSVTVPITPKPNLSIVTATTKALVRDVGEQIPYTFTVTNYGNVPVADLAVTDPLVPTVTCPQTALAPGEHTVCTGTYTTTQADLDAGQVANIAGVTGTAGDGTRVTAHSAVVTVPALYDPALSVVKSSTATSFSSEGEQIPYAFTVANIGNVTLRSIAVTDPKIGAPACPVTELAPGERTNCTGSYTVTQADVDAGELVNQAGAVAVAPSGRDVSATSNQTVIGTPRPGLSIVKASPTVFYDGVGDVIEYTFTVTNTGNQTLSDIVVRDPLVGGTVCTIASLAPGSEGACAAGYTVPAAALDAGRVAGQATASATSPSGPVEATSDNVVVPGIYRPELTMAKSATTTTFDAPGVTIPYRFTVINTGNVTLNDIRIADPRIPAVACPRRSLPLGEQMTCEATYTVTQADVDAGEVVNRATVDGDVPPGGPEIEAMPSNDVTVPGVQRPGLSMVKKSAVRNATAVGQTVRYTFAVSNTGNTTIETIAVTDVKVPRVACPAAVLAPGASMTCTADYTVSQADIDAGQITNVATVTGNIPGGPPLAPVSSNQVEIRATSTTPPRAPGAEFDPAGDAGRRAALAPTAVPPSTQKQTTPTSPGQLPRTGRDLTTLVLAALATGALGKLIRTGTRRRKQARR